MTSATPTQPLLVELLTEELPPKALPRLGDAFATGLEAGLRAHDLLDADCHTAAFASPRRLAVRFSAVRSQAPDREFREKLMPVKVGLTPEGEASPALRKKLEAKGWSHVPLEALLRESDGKQESLYYQGLAAGAHLAQGLQTALDDTLAKLPIPKVMTYQLADGETTVRFVRPAHRLVALLGEQIVPIEVLGLQAGRQTQGHRFQAAEDPITLAHADDYETRLSQDGAVVPSFTARRTLIEAQLRQQAEHCQASLGPEADIAPLLDEVTALVERPAVYVGEFDPEFLTVPPECLILTMRLNQKYFPLFDRQTGALTHRFLIVSNMRLTDPQHVVQGNQRVVRPRLADARFFYETDRKLPLADRVTALGSVVYHNRLGSQLERSRRVAKLCRHVAERLALDPTQAERAAELAKADLVTQMVGEFPELQGIMGAYYAAHDGEAQPVINALRQQYQIRFDHPVNPESAIAATLFLAERVETLTGIWAIGQLPTGDRDPFGLRRAALGVISVFEQLAAGGILDLGENGGSLVLEDLLALALAGLPSEVGESLEPRAVIDALRDFIDERYRQQLLTQYERAAIDAVLAVRPRLQQIPGRIAAVTAFQTLPAASSLAAANKRIHNLLKKADNPDLAVDPTRLTEGAEVQLAQAMTAIAPDVEACLGRCDYAGALQAMATLKDPVDQFFNDVMVMADDPAVRNNRLALLGQLHRMMNQVADIGRLA